MSKVLIKIGTVVEIEDKNSTNGADALRVRVKLNEDKYDESKPVETLPWAFPLLPKTFQSVPKKGEAVLVIADALGEFSEGQRYYIGPLISQPQYHEYCPAKYATTVLQASKNLPIGRISSNDATSGSFPKANDIALVGRGQEDVITRYDDNSNTSEVSMRAGIRMKYDGSTTDSTLGDVIFNDTDPAYIQLKHKYGLATDQDYACDSVVNIVADYVNIMSNHDEDVKASIHDKNTLVNEATFDNTVKSLHQVPKGDKLVELLEIMKGAIMHHVHPWAGMEQCGDKPGNIKKLEGYDIKSILSDFVRIS